MPARFPYVRLLVLLGASLGSCSGCGGKAVAQETLEGDANTDEASDCIHGEEGASLVAGLDLVDPTIHLAVFELTEGHELLEPLQAQVPLCDSEPWDQCIAFHEPVPGFYLPAQARPRALLAQRDGSWEALGYWEVREVLGEVNTKNEAAVIAFTEGWLMDCELLRQEPSGYEFDTASPCAPRSGVVSISSEAEISHSAFCSE